MKQARWSQGVKVMQKIVKYRDRRLFVLAQHQS